MLPPDLIERAVALFTDREDHAPIPPPGLPALIFVRTRASATALSEGLRHALSLRIDYVHAGRTRVDREIVKEKLRAGELDIVCATTAWSTGIDIPGLRSVINATGGRAPIPILQQAGRAVRKKPNGGGYRVYDLSPSTGDKHQDRRALVYGQGGYKVRSALTEPGVDELLDQPASRDPDTVHNELQEALDRNTWNVFFRQVLQVPAGLSWIWWLVIMTSAALLLRWCLPACNQWLDEDLRRLKQASLLLSHFTLDPSTFIW